MKLEEIGNSSSLTAGKENNTTYYDQVLEEFKNLEQCSTCIEIILSNGKGLQLIVGKDSAQDFMKKVFSAPTLKNRLNEFLGELVYLYDNLEDHFVKAVFRKRDIVSVNIRPVNLFS